MTTLNLPEEEIKTLKTQLQLIFLKQARPKKYLKNHEPELYKSFLWLLEHEYKNHWPIMLFDIRNLDKNPGCVVCGKHVSNNGSEFYKTCSYDCSAKIADWEQRHNASRQTCLERYGVTHKNKLASQREKIYKTCEERYGTRFPTQTKQVQEKIKQTCLKKYGVEHVFQSEHQKAVSRKTCLERYGNEYYVKTDRFHEQKRITCLEKYGTENISSLDAIKEQKRLKAQEKYGVDCVLQSEEIKEKIRATNRKRYGVKHPMQNPTVAMIRGRNKMNTTYQNFSRFADICTPEFTMEEYHGSTRDIKYKWKCTKCGYIFEDVYICGLPPVCPHCYNIFKSKPHQTIANWLVDELHYEIENNNRNLIAPQEVDIYIPSKNITFEINGIYWHSERFRGKDFHNNKVEAANRAGFELIHIWEHEFTNKLDAVKHQIQTILGEFDNKSVEKLSIKEISIEQAKEFLQCRVTKTSENISYCLSLVDINDKIQSVMTFNKMQINSRFNYELIQFASNCNFIESGKKLLKYFKDKFDNPSIVVKLDKCWKPYIKLYNQIGFTYLQETKNDYFWFKQLNVYERCQCQKYKLIKLLKEGYDPNLTESENMRMNGFYRLYTCGDVIMMI